MAKPVKDVGEKLKDYVPDISETEIAKKVSKTVSDAESTIMNKTNIYQYGGFKPKSEREKMKAALTEESTDQRSEPSTPENPK